MKRMIVLIAVCGCAASAQAGGFEQVNQSASGAGLSNAFVATANDVSALAYNPAGIAWQQGVTVGAGLGLHFRNSSVSLPTGVAPNEGTDQSVGQFYAAWAPRDSHWSAGFGFSPLYQLNNDWGTAFPGTAGIGKITVDHAFGDVVYAVNSDLAVGLGADWYLTRATLTQGTKSFDDSDFTSFGGHASVLWKFQPGWSAGAVVRSGSSINISGKSNTSLSFKLPDQVTVALAHDLTDVWRLETDVKWTRWSALKSMDVTGVTPQFNPLQLRDTLTIMTGLTWTWTENAQFRMGYAYDQGANRSSNYNPLVADQDGHRISLGAGGDVFGMHADLAYQYTLYSNKTATGTYAGTYRDRRQSLMLSISNQFN